MGALEPIPPRLERDPCFFLIKSKKGKTNKKTFLKNILALQKTWHNYENQKTDFMSIKLRETWGSQKTATHSTNMIINVHERLR